MRNRKNTKKSHSFTGKQTILLLSACLLPGIILAACIFRQMQNPGAKAVVAALKEIITSDKIYPDYEISIEHLKGQSYTTLRAYNNYSRQLYTAVRGNEKRFFDAAESVLYTTKNSDTKETWPVYWNTLAIDFDALSSTLLNQLTQTVIDNQGFKAKTNVTQSDVELTLSFRDIAYSVFNESPPAASEAETSSSHTYEEEELTNEEGKAEPPLITLDDIGTINPTSAYFRLTEEGKALNEFGLFLERDNYMISIIWNSPESVAQSYREEIWHKGENAPSLQTQTAAVLDEMEAMGVDYKIRKQ